MNTIATSNTSGLWILIFPVLMFAFAIWAMVFWIMMLVHSAKHANENKAMWVFLIVLTGILGAVIYYFVVKRPMSKQPVAMTAPAPAPAPAASIPETPVTPVPPTTSIPPVPPVIK